MKLMNISLKAKAVMLAAAVVTVGGVGTAALLTDTSRAEIAVTSANLDLSVNSSTNGIYAVTIDSSNLKPGDSRSGTINVLNTSTIPVEIDAVKSQLVGFDASLKVNDVNVNQLFLKPNESVNVNLTIGLDPSITVPPVNQTLTIDFNTAQTNRTVGSVVNPNL